MNSEPYLINQETGCRYYMQEIINDISDLNSKEENENFLNVLNEIYLKASKLNKECQKVHRHSTKSMSKSNQKAAYNKLISKVHKCFIFYK